MASAFLKALDERVIVFDGSMGATLQSMTLDVESDYLGRENCVDLLVRSRPEMIRAIHESFLTVGADVVETNTFGANRLVLSEFDDEAAGWAYELNREAARIAREACDAHSTDEKPRFAAGSMGPGTKLISLGQTTWEDMLASYTEQAAGLLDGGVDAFLIETCQDLLQVKCATNACLHAPRAVGKRPEDVPIMVSITIETTGTMLLGTEAVAALDALRMFPIASLGLNCATGPTEMGEHVAVLARHWDRHLSIIPNAGLPALVEGKTVFPLGPEPFAKALVEFVDEHGVNIVGGCCGTSPEHIARLCERLGPRAKP
ncbi:MAG: homocysteine S-methyltransferase family protein, partial [Planctomycetota bacterium]